MKGQFWKALTDWANLSSIGRGPSEATIIKLHFSYLKANTSLIPEGPPGISFTFIFGAGRSNGSLGGRPPPIMLLNDWIIVRGKSILFLLTPKDEMTLSLKLRGCTNISQPRRWWDMWEDFERQEKGEKEKKLQRNVRVHVCQAVSPHQQHSARMAAIKWLRLVK